MQANQISAFSYNDDVLGPDAATCARPRKSDNGHSFGDSQPLRISHKGANLQEELRKQMARDQSGNRDGSFDPRGSDAEMQQPIMQLMQMHKQMSGSKHQNYPQQNIGRFSNSSQGPSGNANFLFSGGDDPHQLILA